MSRNLKVYGWSSFRNECDTYHHQTREICAAHSKAEVARIAGVASAYHLRNICETMNPTEVELAMSKRGTIFWKPINGRDNEFAEAETNTP